MSERERAPLSLAALVLVAGASGCSAASRAPTAAKPPAVASARITAAELGSTPHAPRTGKPQRGSEGGLDEAKGSRASSERRWGGGFSGYK